jgi:hypothetical protein
MKKNIKKQAFLWVLKKKSLVGIFFDYCFVYCRQKEKQGSVYPKILKIIICAGYFLYLPFYLKGK